MTRFRLVSIVFGFLLVAASIRPAAAQGLCSGRCLVDWYGHPYCSLSVFGVAKCVEAIDFCVEFPCDEAAMPPVENAATKCSQPQRLATSTIEVVTLRARS
jgi:hypothetical protein